MWVTEGMAVGLDMPTELCTEASVGLASYADGSEGRGVYVGVQYGLCFTRIDVWVMDVWVMDGWMDGCMDIYCSLEVG